MTHLNLTAALSIEQKREKLIPLKLAGHTYSVWAQIYDATENTGQKKSENFLESLMLSRSSDGPSFKWLTQNKTTIGHGDLMAELPTLSKKEAATVKAQLLEQVGQHPDLPLFHSLAFSTDGPESADKSTAEIKKRDSWEKWNFPELLIPKLLIVHDSNHPLIYKVIQLKWMDGPDLFLEHDGFTDIPIEVVKPSTEQLSFLDEDPLTSEHKRKTWNQQVGAVLSRLENEQDGLSKVVLARDKHMKADKPFDPLHLFYHLSQKHSRDNLTHFYLENSKCSFMGFSPENLLKQEQKALEMDAIAGTRVRSNDPIKDQALGTELLESDKDQREHQEVITAIENQCLSFGQLRQGTQEVLKLSHVQHIKTPLVLELNSSTPQVVFDLMQVLHPTPAVGGTPRDEAIKEIVKLEHFNRGLYAGALGLQYNNTCQIVVGIRSLLVPSSEDVFLYAGAGIVEGSDCDQEWFELESKFESFFPKDLLYNKRTHQTEQSDQENI